jgi:hypothetical protein
MINRAKPGLLPIAAVVLLAFASGAQASGAQASQVSQAPISGRPTSGPPTGGPPTSHQPAKEAAEASAGGQPGSSTQAAPVASASAPETAPSVSNSMQESLLQATTRRDQSGGGTQNGGVAESTATAQGIWQVQISSCKAHCRGVRQEQSARQRNKTVQTLRGSRHLTGAGRHLKSDRWKANSGLTPTAQRSTGLVPGSNTGADLVPIAKRNLTESGKPGLTQIQLGCLSHCFGTTTRARPLPAHAPQPTLPELLETIARAMPSLRDVPAAEQNAVVQTSRQWQSGSGLGPGQTQTAMQVSTTVQSHDLPLTDAARSVLGDYVPQLVNQTEQGIWQLQIGCLAFCSETRQVQRAEQSNTTMRSPSVSDDSSPRPPASSVNVTTQTVWQVQVGCLIWCFDTEQQQTSSSENSEGELPRQEAAQGTPPPAGTQPPAGTLPPAGTPPPSGTPPPASSVTRNACDKSPAPGECNPIASLGGAGPWPTGGPARPSPRPANRARRGRLIVNARSGWTAKERGGRIARADGAAESAGVAIYRTGVARAPVVAPRHLMGVGPSGSGRRQSSRISRSLAAGTSPAAESGPDAPPIALVAAIALCTLAAARAFRSEPIPRRRATKK